MVKYILTPKGSPKEENLNMVGLGRIILNILTDSRRSHEPRETIKNYTIDISNKTIEFELERNLDERIYKSLDDCWRIEKE